MYIQNFFNILFFPLTYKYASMSNCTFIVKMKLAFDKLVKIVNWQVTSKPILKTVVPPDSSNDANYVGNTFVILLIS